MLHSIHLHGMVVAAPGSSSTTSISSSSSTFTGQLFHVRKLCCTFSKHHFNIGRSLPVSDSAAIVHQQ
jgi:hypothetical protein